MPVIVKIKTGISLISAIMLLLAPFSVFSASQQEVERVFSLIDENQLRDANRLSSELLKKAPEHPELLFAKALIADKRGDSKRAVSLYQSLTRSHPEILEPFNNLAIHQANTGNFKIAISTLERAMQANPAVATAYRNLTAIYEQQASAAYRKALNSKAKFKPLSLASLDKIHSLEINAEVNIVDQQPVVVAETLKEKSEPVAEPASVEPTTSTNNEIKVTETTPLKAARQAVESNAVQKQALIDHVKSWASAWSDRDVDRYLSHYSGNFLPRDGLTLAAWRKQRHGRLRCREFIVVKPSRYRIEVDGNQAVVNFQQYYKSDRFEDTIRKTLRLEKRAGRWLIVQELI